jgi:hypothetical protein
MSSMPGPKRSLHAVLVLVALLCLGAVAASPASAAEAPAASAEAGAEAAAVPPPATVEFTSRTVSLVGPRALVDVKCAGAAGEPCIGTLALRGSAGAHKVAYSIDCEEEQILVVPLGSNERAIGRLKSVRAVARTLQLDGGSVDTAKRLRIR